MSGLWGDGCTTHASSGGILSATAQNNLQIAYAFGYIPVTLASSFRRPLVWIHVLNDFRETMFLFQYAISLNPVLLNDTGEPNHVGPSVSE